MGMTKLCQKCSKRYLCKEVDTKEECCKFKSWIQTKNYGVPRIIIQGRNKTMPDEERIEQLELTIKILQANNKGLKDKIDEQSKELEQLKDIQQQICNEELVEEKYVKENYVAKDKIKAILKEYGHTKMGDSKRILEFYRKMQSLLEKE